MAYMVSEGKITQILTIGCAGYLLIHLMFAEFIVSNRFVSNTLDEVYANMVYQEIMEYEEETGILVTKMAVIDDAYAPDSYEEVNYAADQINERTLGTVTNSLITVVTGRKFEIVEMNEKIYKEYFENKNWDYFDLEEQIVFENDTGDWCVF